MTHRVRMALLIVISALLVLPASPSATFTQTSLPWVWAGTLSVREVRPVTGRPEGEQVMELQANLRFVEGIRVPVVTVADGRQRETGELIQLVNAGSTQSIRYSGRYTFVNPKGQSVTEFSGGSSGPLTLDHGWIYHSLASDDPLKGILADGAYSFNLSANVSNLQAHTTGWNDTPSGRVHFSRDFTERDRPMFFWTGGPTWWREDSPDWPLSHVYSSIAAMTVEQLRQKILPLRYHDPSTFVVRDGVMQGTFGQRPDLIFSDGMHQTATWHLQKKHDIRGSLTPIARAWRPKRGETLQVTAGLDPALNLKGRFRFTLSEVSRHPGYATNAGGNDTSLDFAFAEGQTGFAAATETTDGWVIETTEAAVQAAVSVEPRDYGAWGRLKAEVFVDGVWYECVTTDGRGTLTLPVDTDEDRIADQFETTWGIEGEPADADRDAQPAGASVGDGFSNFEEYRGFMVMDAWEYTYPGVKDLFVHDEVGLSGENIFRSTGINVHYIQDDEYEPASRIVNFYRAQYATRHQHGLHLIHGDETEPGVLGRVIPVVGPPRDVMFVTVDIFAHYRLPDDVEDRTLDDTVAHELGHAVDIQHHGDWEVNTCGPSSMTAVWNGAHAGDTMCVMRYDGANYYKGWDGQCHAYTWGLMPGSSFCSSKDGTGINAGPRSRASDGRPMPVSGDARVGDCLGQIRIVPR